VVTTSRRPYQYCLHCGKVKEPLAVLKKHTRHSVFASPEMS
jgi:hypothetical protein